MKRLVQLLLVITPMLILRSCISEKGEQQVNNSDLQLLGKRFFTFNTVIRVNQIETSRNEVHGEDESSIHSPAEARVFRKTVEKALHLGNLECSGVSSLKTMMTKQ